MSRQYALRLGLLAFAATTAEGALTGQDAMAGLTTGLARLAVFYGLGLVCGRLARMQVDEQVQRDFERWLAAADAAPASNPQG